MEAVPFSIHVDATGAASVTLGRWRRDKAIAPAATASAEVICSTGEFLYEKLDLGAK